jgi:hypothetical protein
VGPVEEAEAVGQAKPRPLLLQPRHPLAVGVDLLYDGDHRAGVGVRTSVDKEAIAEGVEGDQEDVRHINYGPDFTHVDLDAILTRHRSDCPPFFILAEKRKGLPGKFPAALFGFA